MTSFYTLPLEYLTHEPELIVSFITSTRPFLNCSIVPIILSGAPKNKLYETPDLSLWEKLAENDKNLKWYLLFALSDTLQFSSTMWIPDDTNLIVFSQRIFTPLIRNNPYFTRTLKHFICGTSENLEFIFPLLRQVRSLETVSIDECGSGIIQHLKHLPLRKVDCQQENYFMPSSVENKE